jgi:hypothetical protein
MPGPSVPLSMLAPRHWQGPRASLVCMWSLPVPGPQGGRRGPAGGSISLPERPDQATHGGSCPAPQTSLLSRSRWRGTSTRPGRINFKRAVWGIARVRLPSEAAGSRWQPCDSSEWPPHICLGCEDAAHRKARRKLPQCVPAPLKSDPHAENPSPVRVRVQVRHKRHTSVRRIASRSAKPPSASSSRGGFHAAAKRRLLAWDQAFVVCNLKPPLRSRHTSIARARGLCRRPIVPEAERSTPIGDASLKVPSHFRWTIPLVPGRRMQIKPGTRAVPGCVTLMAI